MLMGLIGTVGEGLSFVFCLVLSIALGTFGSLTELGSPATGAGSEQVSDSVMRRPRRRSE